MENIVATYTKSTSIEWFLDFVKQLAEDNQNRLIEIKDTRLLIHCTGINKIWNYPVMVYSFTGTFGTIKAVTYGEWLEQLAQHVMEVSAA